MAVIRLAKSDVTRDIPIIHNATATQYMMVGANKVEMSNSVNQAGPSPRLKFEKSGVVRYIREQFVNPSYAEFDLTYSSKGKFEAVVDTFNCSSVYIPNIYYSISTEGVYNIDVNLTYLASVETRPTSILMSFTFPSITANNIVLQKTVSTSSSDTFSIETAGGGESVTGVSESGSATLTAIY